MSKKLSSILDSSMKNDGSLSFFMFSNLQWISAFTTFPFTSFETLECINIYTKDKGTYRQDMQPQSELEFKYL